MGDAGGEDDAAGRDAGTDLPAYNVAHRPDNETVVWADKAYADISEQVEEAYHVVASGFRKNVFVLPSGAEGKRYVREMTRLNRHFTYGGPLQVIALTAEKLMPHLLLQRSTVKAESKTRINKANLRRRMDLWDRGEIGELLREAQVLQGRLGNKGAMSQDQLAIDVCCKAA